LSTEALVRFVNGERTAVIAVVVSQLAPHKAVEVLRQLPRETNRAVLQRLSQLQDIDPNAMSAIDEHLAERLSDYQHRIESEHENTRRLNALLQAAPPELQAEWHELLNDTTHSQSAATASASPSNSTMAPLPTTNPRSTQATIAELYGDVVLTTLDAVPGLANPLAARIPVASPAAASTSAPTAAPTAAATAAATAIPASRSSTAAAAPRLDDDRPDILSFAAAQATSGAKPGGAFIPTQHVHFDRLLQLSPQNLATLLSSVDSHTVLLALAGSTPDFMRRFVRMLKPADAKVLTKRLESLGSINLRDVDEAQHRIVEKASDMLAATTDARRQAA
jgi:flagellar motor switch protein FliG